LVQEDQLRFGKGFRIGIGNRAQPVQMALPPGEQEGEH